MIKKIFIQGKYIVITENDKEIFSAPVIATRVKLEDSDTVRIFHETSLRTNQKDVVVDTDKLKDENGDALSGGTIAWLRANTGFNTASGGSEAVLYPYLNNSETDLLIVYGQSNAKGLAATSEGVPENLSDKAQIWNGTTHISFQLISAVYGVW